VAVRLLVEIGLPAQAVEISLAAQRPAVLVDRRFERGPDRTEAQSTLRSS
jgi:hypothetical protein